MPVRSLGSSVLKWPKIDEVIEAARAWAYNEAKARKGVLRIGCFGSYARGDWGVESDLDLIVIAESCDLPFIRRASSWDTTSLPVPADLLVYTCEEWRSLEEQRTRFYNTVMREVAWLYEGDLEDC
jgi:uncharacterized protein